MLGKEDMACWLNGYSALWHPASLWGASRPPRCEVSYDHEQPRSGVVYALPEFPPMILPDDWDERVRAAGSVAFRASADRNATLANLFETLRSRSAAPEGADRLLQTPMEQAMTFFGLGLGHLLLATLSEAMEHENLLDHDAFWEHVQHAVALVAGLPYTPAQSSTTFDEPTGADYPSDFEEYPATSASPEDEGAGSPVDFEHGPPGDDWDRPGEPPPGESPPGEPGVSSEVDDASASADPPWYAQLRFAAEKLQTAREVLYPVAIHLVDLLLPQDDTLAAPWPATFQHGLPLNVVLSGCQLEKLAAEQPQRLEELATRFQAEQVEVCGGGYLEREDALLSVDSQLWNLLEGQATARTHLGGELRVYARKRFGFHPQLPLLLSTTGMTRAVLLSFDEGAVPHYQTCTVSWPSPDGKPIEAFVRQPHPADDSQTFFNLGHYLFKTTREDHTATLAFVHKGAEPAPWYQDFVELTRLAPLPGSWTTLSRYLGEAVSGEYASSVSADEFHFDYLRERLQRPDPVSGFAAHARLRRRIDGCWTLAALHRALAGAGDALDVHDTLQDLEKQLESAEPFVGSAGVNVAQLDTLEQRIAAALAERLQSRAVPDRPGYLILNPCSFLRRLALELDADGGPLPIDGPVKACQRDADKLRVVVEIPALGFAWIDRGGPGNAVQPATRMRLAERTTIRNEFFEAEVDPDSGGLRAIRDHRTRLNRLGQRLVFNPGSMMRASHVKITSSGPALGEIVSEGVLLGEQEQVLARFRQRFRAWLGRPLLDLRIEIEPAQPAAGYPWHAYFGARFAWRDERAVLLRGVNGTGFISTHNRPQTPDFLEIRLARQSTVILPGGLPFHQRVEGRMADVILIPEGEKATTFDIGIGLDREHPMQTALGLMSPPVVVPTTKGPPHIGASGWLFHLDAPNLLLSRMQPGAMQRDEEEPEPGRRDAVTARLLECAAHSGLAEFRCVRNPARAALLDARGGFLLEPTITGDAVLLEVSPGDLVHLQVDFT